MTIITTDAFKRYKEVQTDASGINYEKLPFTDKDSYLAWRMVWRAAYAELSGQIRMLKPLRKSKRDTYDPHAQSTCASLRHLARKMSEQRVASKEKAGKQRAEMKIMVPVPPIAEKVPVNA